MVQGKDKGRSRVQSDAAADYGYRRKLYDAYVSNQMRLTRDYSADAYQRWAANTMQSIGSWLPRDKGTCCLDLGCGHGNVLYLLTEASYSSVEGVDRSPEQVKLARRIVPDVVKGDALQYLKDREDEYGLITAFDLIEHLSKREAVRMLELIWLALEPGGVFILKTPNADSPFGLSQRFNDFTHELCFNPHSLHSLLRTVGFTDLESRESGPVVHGILSAGRMVLWKIIRSSLLVWNLAETGSRGSGVFTRVFYSRAVKPK